MPLIDWQRSIYRLLYLRRPPWDTGITPPELLRLIEEEQIPPGRALDLGCGTGTNAIYLAQHGFEVVGVDFVAKAIAQAREKAHQADVSVTFYVGDVSDLAFLGDQQFDLVVDIGCFHSIPRERRTAYVSSLAAHTRPGSRYLLYAFQPKKFLFREMGLTREEVEALFQPAFGIDKVEEGADPSGGGSAWYFMERLADATGD
jgi:cyclopropane fatty-acyl-phospholipid synthase-like methyltransferase